MAKGDAAADAVPALSPASSNPNLPQGPVEARSLSSITAIASNPPAYPRNPAQKKLDPLVLYIVRVPGSKDVFLTPLKPPTKSSVSAEAINASLYYLHVATPEDDILLQEVEDEREQQAQMRQEAGNDSTEMLNATPEFARMNNVRRKPVPGSGNAASPGPLQAAGFAVSQEPQLQLHQENTPPYPSIVDPRPPPIPPRPPRPPLHQGYSSSSSAGGPPRWASEVCQQSFRDAQVVGNTEEARGPPLPPRQPPRGSRGEAFDTLETDTGARKDHRWSALLNNRGLEGWKERYETLSAGRHSLDSSRPKLRPHTSHESSSSYIRQGSPSRSPARSPNRRPYDRSQSSERPGFHITLIRRDPSHGSQWNVATISMPRMDSGAIDIEVSTPGYNRFLARDEPFSLQSLGINLPSDGRPISLSNFRPPTQASTSEVPPMDPSRPRKFYRQLCVSRPLHRRDDSRDSVDLPTNRASMDTFNNSPGRSHAQGHSKLKSGYYTFTSPWNGICTFSTSVNGRSLKCKHMIPTPSYPGNGMNPSGSNSPSQPPNPAVTVAEIRFNTPFQAGQLHRQPSASHSSPFALSQISAFRETADTLGYASSSIPSAQSNQPASKRASFAHFLNPNSYTRPRSRSNVSTNSNSNSNMNTNTNTNTPSPSPSPSLTPTPTPTPIPTTTTTPSHARKPSASSTDSADERLDLSLAREPAGGGMRGKSAKLGKLIIEDEGIKMLDLAVAACMAVWWRGYYY